MNSLNLKIDQYLAAGCGRCPLGGTPQCKVHSWTGELEMLRSIVLECGLTEELKWGVPCYTLHGKNVLLVSAFREYCAVSFFKGALLKDPHGILVAPGKHSQASRILRFTSTEEVTDRSEIIKDYVREAMEVEASGQKVEFRKNPEPISDELQQRLDEDLFFRTAFENLTPGRQRGYIIHFSQPKQASTRISRIERCVPKILNGEGLHDKYSPKR